MHSAARASSSLPLGSYCVQVACPYGEGRCDEPKRGRYQNNVDHQNQELTYPIVDAAVHRRAAPAAIWWRFVCLPLTAALLSSALPRSALVCGANSTAPPACVSGAHSVTEMKPVGSKSPFPLAHAYSASALQRSVYHGCSITDRATPVINARPHFRVRVLEREPAHPGDGERCGMNLASSMPSKRRLSNRTFENIRSGLPKALKKAGGDLHEFAVVKIPGSTPGSLCEQARRFANADILISVHGAHLVNIAMMRPGSILLEVTPWANFMVSHYKNLAENLLNVTRLQLCAKLPDRCTAKTCRGNDEKACALSQGCRESAQNCFELEPEFGTITPDLPCKQLSSTLVSTATTAVRVFKALHQSS